MLCYDKLGTNRDNVIYYEYMLQSYTIRWTIGALDHWYQLG